MDFGIFNVMQQRHHDKSSQQIVDEAVDQTRVAEQLGFSRAWYAEHHFSNYSLCPSPLMMVAHCAALTSRIRLGSAVLVAPLYTPARLLAEIALTDTFTKGRLDIGFGTGYQNYEFERFGVDLDKNREMTHELLDMIQAGLTQPNFTYDGSYYKQPKTAISIRPVQQPIPPIWFAGNDPKLHRRAAREGHTVFISGVLGSNNRLLRSRQSVEDSYRAEGVDPANMKLGVLRFAFVSKDKKKVEHYVDCARYQQRLAVSLKLREETVVNEYMIEEKPYDAELPFEKMAENIPAGDVETVTERLVDLITKVRPTHIAIQPQLGDISHRDSLDCMELFMSDVVPGIEKALGRPLAEINTPPTAVAAE